MPVISAFYGIVITMNWSEHNPPHFHARYGGEKALFSISDLRIIAGRLSPRATALILEWAFQYRDQLIENWELMRNWQEPHTIPPLP
jgi:hypothetical protein